MISPISLIYVDSIYNSHLPYRKSAICSLRLYARPESWKAAWEALRQSHSCSFLLQEPRRPEDHERVFWALQHLRLAEARSHGEGLCIRGHFLLRHVHHGHHDRNSVAEFETEERGPIHPPLPPSAASPPTVAWGRSSKGCGPWWPAAPCRSAGWCLGSS